MGVTDMIKLVEQELYQEIELYVEDVRIGSAEVDVKNKMLCKLCIYEPYQNCGYGQEIVKMLIDKYGCDCLWVEEKNERAIHVYEKLGFAKTKPTMFMMERESGEDE